ncbi:hypothetical protein SDJN02_27628, partial [Cucurbita argyrosperma subsp. argyrosperma]
GSPSSWKPSRVHWRQGTDVDIERIINGAGHQCSFLPSMWSRYVKTEFYGVTHVGTPVVVVDGLSCENTIRKYDLLVVESKKNRRQNYYLEKTVTCTPSISHRSPTSNGCITNKKMIASKTVLQIALTTQFFKDDLLIFLLSDAPSNRLMVFEASSSTMKRIKSSR